MITSENVDKILPALLKVKLQLQAVAKTSNNPFFKSKYADLNSHLDAIEPLLHEEGLVLLQPVVSSDAGNFVVSRIYHAESGQFVQASMKLIGESDMQKAGSAVTYGRRYTLSLLTVKAEDDDGNAASGKSTGGSKTFSNSSAPKSAPAATSGAKPSFRKPKKEAVQVVTEEVVESQGDDL